MILMVPPRDKEDGAAVTFSPFLQFVEEFRTGVKINRSDVLTVNTPVKEVLNQYNSIFGSGIVLASSL
jgi:signal recognition particle receptor subunit beta